MMLAIFSITRNGAITSIYHAPVTLTNVKQTDSPHPPIEIAKYTLHPKWWTPELQRLKNKRNKEWKRRSECGDTNYTKALFDFNNLFEKKQNEYLITIQNKIKADPAAFWKYARERDNKDSYPSTMHYNDKSAETPQDCADLFADSFQTYFRSDDSNVDLEQRRWKDFSPHQNVLAFMECQ